MLVENRALDVFFRAKLVIDERVRPDIARPALHESAFVAGRQVMEFEDAQQIVADLDQIALAKPCCLNGRHAEDRTQLREGPSNMLR